MLALHILKNSTQCDSNPDKNWMINNLQWLPIID